MRLKRIGKARTWAKLLQYTNILQAAYTHVLGPYDKSGRLMRLCGVYKIINKVTGHKYIGGSVHILRRWNHHKKQLERNQHSNKTLQRAWNRDGEESFPFHIVQLCSPTELTAVEQSYLPREKTVKALIRGKYYNRNPIVERGIHEQRTVRNIL